jgi:hypothetical protein
MLAENAVARANGTRAQTPPLLRALIFAPGGQRWRRLYHKERKLYRYHVATGAIRHGYAECSVCSVPAAEMEEAVVAQVQHLLRTPEIIARTLAACGTSLRGRSARAVQIVLRAALGELFPAEQARIARPLVERIDLVPEGKRAADVDRGTAVAGGEGGAKTKRKGGRQELAVLRQYHQRPNLNDLEASLAERWSSLRNVGDAWAPAKPRPDETLIRALARAHRWKRMLDDATYRSAAEIAEAEGVTRSFVNRLLRLTLLAPDIVEAVLDGRHPKGMQLEELTRAMPSAWDEQRQHLLGR